MAGQTPMNPLVRWIDHRLPIFTYMHHELHEYPTPKNLNYWWNFGSLAGIILVIMLVTGIVLAMHYTPHVDYAFQSVERIMRDVNYGWLMRYIHANGASFFFIVVYIHIFRGMYYGSYKAPRELLWILGVVILLLMMATAFMGYVLPWGQMSFWGATVITNLFSAIPLVGDWIVTLLWGGFAVENPTLNRFFSLHYLLPFAIVGVVVLHIIALHRFGSNNRLGSTSAASRIRSRSTPTTPSRTCSDSGIPGHLFGRGVFPAQRHGTSRQLHPGQSAVDAGPYCPGMVLPAVLRHSQGHTRQADRRPGHVRGHRRSVHPAMAGSFTGAQWQFPADLSHLFLGPGRRLRAAGLSRRQAAGRHLRDPGPARYRVLFLPLPDPAAGAVDFRNAQTTAKQHQPARTRPRRWSGNRIRRCSEGEKVMRRQGLFAVVVMLVCLGSTGPNLKAADSGVELPSLDWSFDGVFGTYDRASMQRGFQVYREVCASCHSLDYIAFRNLADLGFSEDEIKAIALEYEVEDGPDAEGEMYFRGGIPSDRFPAPFPNENAARASNNGALPPDLSLMVEARNDGANYLFALLTGYRDEPPPGVEIAEGMSYNAYFPGHQIAMPPPLFEDGVEYADGTPATLEQQARDLTTFLAWASEPNMEDRKQMGIKVIIFLLVMTVLLYFSKRRIWASVH